MFLLLKHSCFNSLFYFPPNLSKLKTKRRRLGQDANFSIGRQVIDHQRTIHQHSEFPHMHLPHHNAHRNPQFHEQRDPVTLHVIRKRLLQLWPKVRFPLQIDAHNRRILIPLIEARNPPGRQIDAAIGQNHPAPIAIDEPDLLIRIIRADAEEKLGVQSRIGEEIQGLDLEIVDHVIGDFGIVN